MWWKRKAKYEDLKAKLDKEIFQFLERKDFQRDNENSVYYLVYKKKTSFGFEIFELEFLILSKELKVVFGLRFNEIENIYGQVHQMKLPENSLTLFIDSVELLYFKEVEKAKFKFEKIEDVKIGLENTKHIFENYAANYFKKYGSLEKFNNLVNRERYEEDLRGNFNFHGNKEDAAINGIIASKILKEKGTENLKKKHLSNNQSESLESIFKLVDEYFERKN